MPNTDYRLFLIPCLLKTPPTLFSVREGHGVDQQPKLQALVYDILPSTTAVFSYAIGSRKLSANEQGFFFGGGGGCVCFFFFFFFVVLRQ